MPHGTRYDNELAIGYVTGGSLQEGLAVALHQKSMNQHGIGSFIVIITQKAKLFCIVADLAFDVPANILPIYDSALSLLLEKVHEKACSYKAVVHALWQIEDESVSRVTGMPFCFAQTYHASEEDIIRVWNNLFPYDIQYAIGTFCGGKSEVTLPLKALVSRSNAIFGKTGTGKTFVARYIFGGIIANKIAALLIFDMHNEYAYFARQEHSKKHVEGLKTLFPQQVMVASLDTKRNSVKCDIVLQIPLTMIHIDDVLALQRELVLHPTACEAAYLLYARFSQRWLIVLMEHETTLASLAQEVGAHVESIAALHRKLKRVTALSFITNEHPSQQTTNGLHMIITALAKGISIIVEFGSCNHTLSYLLVANILTRMLHNAHVKKTEHFIEQQGGSEPIQVVIVIEEAHKFLHPSLAHQTPFGMIAREMRKYYLSLFIIDQRPSHIDNEILSQLGTKFLLSISDSSDCDAVLHGIERNNYIKHLLATVNNKQQLIIVGHVASIPAKIQIHNYALLQEYVTKKTTAHQASHATVVGALFD